MIGGLVGTTIYCEDQAQLAPFYRDVIGLQVRAEEPGETHFGGDEGGLLIVGTHSEVHGSAREPERQIPSLLTDDVRAEYARLRERGVEFVAEPATEGGVTFVTLRDPEGNLVNLLQFD
ncbi:MAG: VOC family protein [Dehalococcoidia bacterium]|nr:VOC family protein [Dehalococcoidia bacterium]